MMMTKKLEKLLNFQNKLHKWKKKKDQKKLKKFHKMQKKVLRIKLKKKILILKILILDQDLKNFQHFRKNQITIQEEMILMILILTKLWEIVKIKIQMILISILMTIINRKKKVKKMQFQIYLTFSEEVLYLNLIISNSRYNNKMPWIFSIMEQATQDLLHSKTLSTKIHSKMFLALELQIRSIKINRTIMYNRCSKHKCSSSSSLINKTKKSQNSFQIQYSCHKCNQILVSNNYFINNKQREV